MIQTLPYRQFRNRNYLLPEELKLSSLREIFEKYGIRPKKRFGQNFLTDNHYLDAIVDAAQISDDDTIIEIGAGFGNLTSLLAERARRVLAIEFDRDMVRALKGEVKSDNVEIIKADALEVDYIELISNAGVSRQGVTAHKTKVIANLPYNIATEIIFRLLDAHECFSTLLLMTQLEVARRIVAEPGGKDYGVLSVLTNLWAETSIEMIVPAGAFVPKPKVDSAVVRFDMLHNPKVDIKDEMRFKTIVKGAFGQRRKTIANALAGHAALGLGKQDAIDLLEGCGIDPKRRPETLSIQEFAHLHDHQA